MAAVERFRDRIPSICENLLELADRKRKTEITAIARYEEQMAEVDQAVRSLPTDHEIHLSDTRDMSMVNDDIVHLVVTSLPYFNTKNTKTEERMSSLETLRSTTTSMKCSTNLTVVL